MGRMITTTSIDAGKELAAEESLETAKGGLARHGAGVVRKGMATIRTRWREEGVSCRVGRGINI